MRRYDVWKDENDVSDKKSMKQLQKQERLLYVCFYILLNLAEVCMLVIFPCILYVVFALCAFVNFECDCSFLTLSRVLRDTFSLPKCSFFSCFSIRPSSLYL